MLPDLKGAQTIRGNVTLPREGTSPIQLSAWKDDRGVHFITPGAGAREVVLTEGTVFEFEPAPRTEPMGLDASVAAS